MSVPNISKLSSSSDCSSNYISKYSIAWATKLYAYASGTLLNGSIRLLRYEWSILRTDAFLLSDLAGDSYAETTFFRFVIYDRFFTSLLLPALTLEGGIVDESDI